MLPGIESRPRASTTPPTRTAAAPQGEGPLVGLVSLGCPKNLVDSEGILGRLAGAGFVVTAAPEEAEILIVNTCGFVGDAKQESIDTLLEMAQHKETGRCRYLVATGCLTQRYATELAAELPEVDAWLGFETYPQIERVLHDLYGGRIDGVPVRVSDPAAALGVELGRLRLTPRHYAYLRISEGCDKTCTFCSIPAIRGAFRSKPLEAVIEEAQELVRSGARELHVISQDTLHYGVDLGTGGRPGKRSIARLVERLCAIDGLDWLRLWYLYPGKLPDGLAEQIRDQPKVVPYLDMPIQHADPGILKAMRRPFDLEAMRDQLAALRALRDGLVLRTTAIVGFPGEGEREFERLLATVEEVGFERLGVFLYSREEGTAADTLEGHVPERTKKRRHRALVARAKDLLLKAQARRVGKVEPVLVDGPAPGRPGLWAARGTADGPDVDPVVLLPDAGALVGRIVPARITAVDGIDLVGVALVDGVHGDGTRRGADARARGVPAEPNAAAR